MYDEANKKTISAFVWSFFERVGQQGISFIFSIILARLLLPKEFGLLGMLSLFFGISQIFIDCGFGASLIRKQNPTTADISSIFYFNISVGILIGIIVYFSAPLIAQFYHEPLLSPLTRFLSLNIPINSLGMVQMNLLLKKSDFKTQAKLSFSSSFLGGIVGVALAFHGLGVWSLATQQVFSSILRNAFLWVYSDWRPSLQFKYSSLREMLPYGSRLWISSLLNIIFENSYFVVIGKFFSAESLGFYSRAWTLQQLPAGLLSSVVLRVTFPLFASLQAKNDSLKAIFRKVLISIAWVNFPVFAVLATISKSLIIVLLSEKWLPCAPHFQLLCIVGFLYPLHAINLNLLSAKGRSDYFLYLEILKKCLVIMAIFATFRMGIEAMIVGQISLSVIALIPNTYFTEAMIGYSRRDQIQDCLLPFIAGILISIAIHLVGNLPFSNVSTKLLFQILSGMIFYILIGHLWKCPLLLIFRKYF